MPKCSHIAYVYSDHVFVDFLYGPGNAICSECSCDAAIEAVEGWWCSCRSDAEASEKEEGSSD
jgi:hypothetical protein